MMKQLYLCRWTYGAWIVLYMIYNYIMFSGGAHQSWVPCRTFLNTLSESNFQAHPPNKPNNKKEPTVKKVTGDKVKRFINPSFWKYSEIIIQAGNRSLQDHLPPLSAGKWDGNPAVSAGRKKKHHPTGETKRSTNPMTASKRTPTKNGCWQKL